MAKVIVIKSSMTTHSPKGSISNAALDKFMEIYKAKNPGDIIQLLDLNQDIAGTKALTDANMAKYWDGVDKYIDQLKSADKLILSSPMTNFNYTAVLKNYLDKILVAGKTFRYKYDGNGVSEGLLTNLTVQLITTQGAPKGWYSFGDHTISLKGTFEFMGTKVLDPIVIAGVKTKEMIELTKEEVVEKFLPEIKNAAEAF